MTTMETYRYSALDERGDKVTGTEKATSSARHTSPCSNAACSRSTQGAQEHSEVRDHEEDGLAQRGHALLTSAQRLHRGRIPIMQSLDVIAEETTDKLLKSVLLDMIVQLQAGETFATAAASHPEAFPRYYVAVLESAELTGTLDKVLHELAEYLAAGHRCTVAGHFRRLIYPGVVAAWRW